MVGETVAKFGQLNILVNSAAVMLEKTAIDNTTIGSSAGTLQVRFASSDSQFSSLLQSPLFQSVVH